MGALLCVAVTFELLLLLDHRLFNLYPRCARDGPRWLAEMD
jgi:hypothetical protein